MDKIPVSIKTQRLNEWNVAFPDFKKTGTNKISKFIYPFIFNIELIWGRFDNKRYIPYVSIESCISPLCAVPSPCINRQSKFDTGKIIYMDTYSSSNILIDILPFAHYDFIPVTNNKISVSFLINIFEQEINSGRAIFGTHFEIYRSILYLYSISKATDKEKFDKKLFYENEIKKNEHKFRLLYKKNFDSLFEQINSFFMNSSKIENDIEDSIIKYKISSLKYFKLIID